MLNSTLFELKRLNLANKETIIKRNTEKFERTKNSYNFHFKNKKKTRTRNKFISDQKLIPTKKKKDEQESRTNYSETQNLFLLHKKKANNDLGATNSGDSKLVFATIFV